MIEMLFYFFQFLIPFIILGTSGYIVFFYLRNSRFYWLFILIWSTLTFLTVVYFSCLAGIREEEEEQKKKKSKKEGGKIEPNSD